MKKLFITGNMTDFEQFVNRTDIEVLQVDVKGVEQSVMFQQSFIAIIFYQDLQSKQTGTNTLVSGSLPPIEFADELLGDYEMSTFDNGDLCWVLAGTNQKYSTEQIYKILSGNDR